jgi:hypothetical protein
VFRLFDKEIKKEIEKKNKMEMYHRVPEFYYGFRNKKLKRKYGRKRV